MNTKDNDYQVVEEKEKKEWCGEIRKENVWKKKEWDRVE